MVCGRYGLDDNNKRVDEKNMSPQATKTIAQDFWGNSQFMPISMYMYGYLAVGYQSDHSEGATL